jgi:hypothetical protein
LQLVVLEDEGDKNDVLRQKRGGQRQYSYDVVFGEDATQVRKIIFLHFIITHLLLQNRGLLTRLPNHAHLLGTNEFAESCD